MASQPQTNYYYDYLEHKHVQSDVRQQPLEGYNGTETKAKNAF